MDKLPISPTIQDLFKYSKVSLKKKRMRRKFIRNWSKYVSNDIYVEYMAKCYASILRGMKMNYAELGKKLIMVEELPQSAYANYVKGELSLEYKNNT